MRYWWRSPVCPYDHFQAARNLRTTILEIALIPVIGWKLIVKSWPDEALCCCICTEQALTCICHFCSNQMACVWVSWPLNWGICEVITSFQSSMLCVKICVMCKDLALLVRVWCVYCCSKWLLPNNTGYAWNSLLIGASRQNKLAMSLLGVNCATGLGRSGMLSTWFERQLIWAA